MTWLAVLAVALVAASAWAIGNGYSLQVCEERRVRAQQRYEHELELRRAWEKRALGAENNLVLANRIGGAASGQCFRATSTLEQVEKLLADWRESERQAAEGEA